jgi:hypothetical protein
LKAISQNLDIGDLPNHTVRLFETHNTVPNNAATINGVKIVEIISGGVGDMTDGHGGSSSSYLIFVAENGDKADILEALPDFLDKRRVSLKRDAAKEPDHRHPHLLRPRRQRPCRCAAESCNEFAPPHLQFSGTELAL